mmetsp:Transcript_36249/g.79346  ORF Transcript_36249/g.79346 Transcript_36249/m.79346 type:complete len:594 (-) Transcript_36249:168-1949(-)
MEASRAEPDRVDLHELAKGWKAAIARASDPATRLEAQVKNDRGNLPLHTAASFRAPLEVAEALLEAYPEAASITNNYGNLALHFTAWKKGPLDVEKLLLRIFPEGAARKNNHGNLPLHYAAHYNAPLEVVEALYRAYPEAAHQKNNDSNTPLDLAIADGASPNVVALLQGKTSPPSDDEVFEGAKSKCERMEKELQRGMESHDVIQEELESVLSLLMDIKEAHPHALFSAGVDPTTVTDMDSLLQQVRRAGEEDRGEAPPGGVEESQLGTTPLGAHGSLHDDDHEIQMIEDALVPPDDEVEGVLSKIIGLETVKNQIRGLRRTIELEKMDIERAGRTDAPLPRHMAFVGNPGTGKTFVADTILPLLFKIGAVSTPNIVTACRDDLVDRKSESRTVEKTRRVLEKASGGVLFVDEAYTLFPSTARPRGRDHGAAALREIASCMPSGSPLIVLAGYAEDLDRVLAANVVKNSVLLRVEFPDPSPSDIARMFLAKLGGKGLVPGDGLSVEYLSELLSSNTDEEWRFERNGRITDLLLNSVRNEIKRRVEGGVDTESRQSTLHFKALPSPVQEKVPMTAPEEVVVTVEDLERAMVNL